MRGAVIEQAPQLVYKFSPRIEITLQLANLVLRCGDLFRRFLVENCGNDVELGLDGFVCCGGAHSESRSTAWPLFRNSSVNDIGKSLRRPDNSHNCDLL